MNTLDEVVSRGRRRIGLVRGLRGLVVCLAAGAGGVALLRLAGRLTPELVVDWSLAWSVAVGSSTAAAAAWAATRWPSRLDAARILDERGELREALATGLWARERDGAWHAAAVSEAERVSAGLDVGRAAPLRAPRGWYVPVLAVLLFAGAGLLPQWDVFRSVAEAEAEAEQTAAVEDARREVREVEDRVREALAGVEGGESDDLEEMLEGWEQELAQLETPDEIRAEALERLTELNDKIENDADLNAKRRELEELRDRLAQLDTPDGSPLAEALARALRAGDMETARKALEALAEQLASMDLSDEQREALAEALRDMAEQLDELAENREALERALREAGLDPELASDQDALERALESSNLSEAQKQRLRELAEATNSACKQCSGMGRSLSRMASGLGSGSGQSGGSGGLVGLMNRLSDAEMLQQEAAAAARAQGKLRFAMKRLGDSMSCKSGQCAGGMFGKAGRGGREAGRTGTGGTPEDLADESNFSTTPTRFDSAGGEDAVIIGRRVIHGPQVRGEARQEMADVARASAERASKAVEDKVIPRVYHDAIKHYFGELEREAAADPDAGGDGG